MRNLLVSAELHRCKTLAKADKHEQITQVFQPIIWLPVCHLCVIIGECGGDILSAASDCASECGRTVRNEAVRNEDS